MVSGPMYLILFLLISVTPSDPAAASEVFPDIQIRVCRHESFQESRADRGVSVFRPVKLRSVDSEDGCESGIRQASLQLIEFRLIDPYHCLLPMKRETLFRISPSVGLVLIGYQTFCV